MLVKYKRTSWTSSGSNKLKLMLFRQQLIRGAQRSGGFLDYFSLQNCFSSARLFAAVFLLCMAPWAHSTASLFGCFYTRLARPGRPCSYNSCLFWGAFTLNKHQLGMKKTQGRRRDSSLLIDHDMKTEIHPIEPSSHAPQRRPTHCK